MTAPFTNPINRSRCRADVGDRGQWRDRRLADSWLGAPSPAEAARRVEQGWPEGAERVLKAMEEISVPAPVQVQRRLTRCEQGDELDIHAVLRGALDQAWTARRRKRTLAPLAVRVVAQVNLLSRTDFDELFWRGAAVVKLVDALVNAGYSVEVLGAIASYTVSGVTGDFLVDFPLKSPRAPLDVPMLAGVTCNAGFHRLYGFRLYYALAPELHHGASTAHSDPSGRVLPLGDFGADGTPTFTVPYGIGNQASAQEWVRAQLEILQ